MIRALVCYSYNKLICASRVASQIMRGSRQRFHGSLYYINNWKQMRCVAWWTRTTQEKGPWDLTWNSLVQA